MNTISLLVTILLIILLIFISVHRYLLSKNVKLLIVNIILLLIYSSLIYNYFYINEAPVSKGADTDTVINEIIRDIICLAVIIFGMFCNYVFSHFILPREDRDKHKIDWEGFIAPVCASLLILFPTINSLKNAGIDPTNSSFITLWLSIAFQNGFFWKEIFNRVMSSRDSK